VDKPRILVEGPPLDVRKPVEFALRDKQERRGLYRCINLLPETIRRETFEDERLDALRFRLI
jgi:hypothetical protein